VALLHDTPRTATVRARLPSVLYTLSRDNFNSLLVTAPGLRGALETTVDERSKAGAKRSAATMVQRRDEILPG
jgi:CRP-like cAMP-binding protein